MRALVLSLLLMSLLSVPASRAVADTVFHYLSESQDPASGGVERTLTPANGASFQASGQPNNVIVSVYKPSPGGSSQIDEIRFEGPDGAALAVGDYPNAADTPAAGSHRPTLSFFENGSSPTATGQFTILEITFDANGILLSFAANFATHEFPDTPTTFGEIRYNSSVPYLVPSGAAELSSNTYTVFETDGQLVVNVTRREGSTGALAVDYTTGDDTAQAGRDYVAAAGTLHWADGDTANQTFTVPLLHPGDPSRGNSAFQLLLSGPGAGVQSQAEVTVITDDSAITFLHYQSDLGEFLGQGQERTLSIANKFVITPQALNGGISFDASNEEYTDFQDEQDYRVSMAAAAGEIFGVGDYQGVGGYPQPGDDVPELDFTGDGRSSDAAASNFQVLEAVYDDDGNLMKYAANYELHNYGNAPALYGQVRYRSTVPLPPERLRQVNISNGNDNGITPTITDLYGLPGIFTVMRSGDLSQPLQVAYTVSGSGVSGQDFAPLKGVRTIKAGKASAQIKLLALPTGGGGISKRIVRLTLTPQPDQYEVVGTGSAKIKILHYGE